MDPGRDDLAAVRTHRGPWRPALPKGIAFVTIAVLDLHDRVNRLDHLPDKRPERPFAVLFHHGITGHFHSHKLVEHLKIAVNVMGCVALVAAPWVRDVGDRPADVLFKTLGHAFRQLAKRVHILSHPDKLGILPAVEKRADHTLAPYGVREPPDMQNPGYGCRGLHHISL